MSEARSRRAAPAGVSPTVTRRSSPPARCRSTRPPASRRLSSGDSVPVSSWRASQISWTPGRPAPRAPASRGTADRSGRGRRAASDRPQWWRATPNTARSTPAGPVRGRRSHHECRPQQCCAQPTSAHGACRCHAGEGLPSTCTKGRAMNRQTIEHRGAMVAAAAATAVASGLLGAAVAEATTRPSRIPPRSPPRRKALTRRRTRAVSSRPIPSATSPSTRRPSRPIPSDRRVAASRTTRSNSAAGASTRPSSSRCPQTRPSPPRPLSGGDT